MTNPLGKAFEFTKATLFGLDEPVIQVLGAVLGQHQDKCLGELVGDIEIRVSRPDLFDKISLLLIEFGRLADT